MRERKVWQLFNLLKNTEKLDFQRWLSLEYGTKQQYVQKLYACLIQTSSSTPTSKEIWDLLYPELAYNDARLRKLCRDLGRQLERFLAFQLFMDDEQSQDIYLLKALNQREAPHLFLKTIKKIKRDAKGTPVKDAVFYRQQYEMDVEIQRYLSKYVRNKTKREKLFPNQYDEMILSFDSWWAEEKLQLALGKKDRGEKTSACSHELLLKDLVQQLQKDEYWHSNVRLQVYMQVYLLLEGNREDSINPLLNLIRETENQWTVEELRNFLTSMINAYIQKLNEWADQAVATQLFSLFEWGIESRLFFTDNNLPPIIYKNLISICLSVENFERALSYLESCKGLLPKQDREENHAFNLGRYHFHRKSYKEVISCFAGQRFSNIFDEIDARMYLLQAHYELGLEEPEWIARLLGTLSRFVKNQSLSPQFKQAMIRGVKLFKKLLYVYTPKEYEELLQQIQGTRHLYRANWLEEKVLEKIEKGRN